MKRHNLHTHTNYSDGKHTPEDLITLAQENGIEILGISDHAFSKKLPDYFQITGKLETYLEHLKKLKASKSVVLKIGIEIDVSTNYGTSPALLPFKLLNEFDYLLFEYVQTENEYWGNVGERNISELVEVRDKFTIPIGLAHNDLQKNFAGSEKLIAGILAENDIFLELNQSEYRGRCNSGRNTRAGIDYYRHFSELLLDELKENEVKVTIGTDSHSGKSLGKIDDAINFVEENKLSYHLLAE
ncbi:PHP domain-containing protein [Candidatus Riflebacteria bacterium]